MKKVYKPYWEWEDYINGMWRKVNKEQESVMLQQAIEFTGNHIEYGNAMREVSKVWVNTMLNSLSNTSINRKAFIGHCAVQFKLNIPEYITRMAWKYLSNKQRALADNEAEKTIKQFIKNNDQQNKPVYKGMGIQMLLQWDTR
jgi:hypothetical protein